VKFIHPRRDLRKKNFIVSGLAHDDNDDAFADAVYFPATGEMKWSC